MKRAEADRVEYLQPEDGRALQTLPPSGLMAAGPVQRSAKTGAKCHIILQGEKARSACAAINHRLESL
jgi:hypothetical protein